LTGSLTSFTQGQTTADLGFGITVNSVTVSDSTHATVNITVAPGAPAGPRNVSVTTGAETLSSVLTVAGVPGLVAGWGLNATQPPAPAGPFKSIAAGDTHNLGLRLDGKIVGWG
jgi:hypothetical protein